MRRRDLLKLTAALAGPALRAEGEAELYSAPQPKADGYHGIWYYNQPSGDQYRYKYSGGFATYPQQQGPLAHYAEQARKTFFCYGGTRPGKQELIHLVSYFDHKTGEVPRPTILLDKKTGDAHDNPVMTIDSGGHLWIFSNAHGTARPAYIHRSREPYSIDAFEHVLTTNFSYCHAWHVPGSGIFLPHTRYENGGRSLYSMSSETGERWSEPKLLARFAKGHYQITCQRGPRIASVFNVHPEPVGLNARTNLYYVETSDFGRTWQSIDGKTLETPLTDARVIEPVQDYEAEGLLVYLKTVEFDAEGRPVILFLTSKGYASGPESGPRVWRTARWTGSEWQIRTMTESDHSYDFGSLYIEDDGTWRVIAPTDAGPQPYGTGGEMVMWTSQDLGAHWKRLKTLTRNSPRNHTYARKPVNAHPDFYALWADGNAWEPSESSLYFTDRAGSAVWRLPDRMDAFAQAPSMF